MNCIILAPFFPWPKNYSFISACGATLIESGFPRGPVNVLRAYFKNPPLSRIVLWCYLIWYLTMGFFYFDPSPRIRVTSLGISGVIGIALMLSVSSPSGRSKPDFWQIFRLFLMPFYVSSFSSLVKNNGFILIFSPRPARPLPSYDYSNLKSKLIRNINSGLI